MESKDYKINERAHKLNLIDDTRVVVNYNVEHIICDDRTIVIVHYPDGVYTMGIVKYYPEDKFDNNERFLKAFDQALNRYTPVSTIEPPTPEEKSLADYTKQELIRALLKKI